MSTNLWEQRETLNFRHVLLLLMTKPTQVMAQRLVLVCSK